MDLFFCFTPDPQTAVNLTLDVRKIASVIWFVFIIYGIGRLGLFYSFNQLARFERIALRLVAGISAMIVIGVAIHAVGFGLGLTSPRYHIDNGFPEVSPGPLGFGPALLLLLALVGYALDVRDLIIAGSNGTRWVLFPGLENREGRIEAYDAINYFGPGIVVVLTALYWFRRFYVWAMAYAWLADKIGRASCRERV